MKEILLELFRLEETKKTRPLTALEISRYEILISYLEEDAKKIWSDTAEKQFYYYNNEISKKRKKEQFLERCKRGGLIMIKAEDLLNYGGFDIKIGYTDDYYEEFGKVTELLVNEKDKTILLIGEKERIRL